MARKKKITENSLRKSLIKQLSDQGADVDHYIDFVEDYLKLRKVKEGLLEDIEKRGTTYVEENSTHVKVWKTNPSIKDAATVDRQMLLILRELKLTTDNAGGGDDGKL